jgi:ribosomal peptide maturation radical SAM protein 1
MKRVLLVNMPFAEIGFPSLALGLFKARFQQEGIPCDVAYLNILFTEMVGLDNYAAVGLTNGLLGGEQAFARTLFGNYIPDDSQYYAQVLAKAPQETAHRLFQIKPQVLPFLQKCLNGIAWQSYDIIGFTSLFEQNLPSLALAYQIKSTYPDKIIVFGGANCEDVMGLTLHRCFPFVDYVCSGEADDTFPELVKRLSYGHPVHDLPGIVYRHRGESIYTGDAPKIHDLDRLPFPDYDDFFRRMQASPQFSTLGTWIVMETARGCWWGQKSKCTFCGLNGKTIEFRSKSVSRVVDEIRHLHERYRQYSVNFFRMADNVIDPAYFDDLLPELARMSLGVQFFFEVRPTLNKRQLKALAQAGVTNIQPGLENLSTHILKLMRKGTSSLQNVQLLKWSKQQGITASWNMIFGFPGEVAADYARCVELAQVLTHLNPPIGYGPFRMDRFSYNFECAAELGLVDVRPFSMYRYVYPFDDRTLFDLGYYFDYDHRQPIDDGGLYQPLMTQIQNWRGRQDHLYSQRSDGHIIVYDSRPVAAAPELVLEGVPRLVYEYCDRSKTLGQIQRWLHDRRGVDLGQADLQAILDDFVAKKLMIEENGLYLSLAIMTYTPEFEEQP